MRLIDVDALGKFIDYGHLNNPNEKLYSENDIREMIDMMPTIEPKQADDLISRADAMAYPISWENYDKSHGDTKFVCGVESYREYIEYLPSAQPTIKSCVFGMLRRHKISRLCELLPELWSKDGGGA